MGTLLWQLNDCWPVTSWSITDYSREPKAAWYAVKEAYRDDVLPVKDAVYPKDLKLLKPTFTFTPMGEGGFTITSNVDAAYVYLYSEKGMFRVDDNYFSLKAGVPKRLQLSDRYFSMKGVPGIKIKSLYDVLNTK